MNHSIFDLYGGPAKKAVMVRQPYTYSKLPEAPSSPDSVQWEDSCDSTKALPALTLEQANAMECKAEASVFHTFHPEAYLEPVAGARGSVYGPIRFWPRSRRPSRNFSETYSYTDNLKCMQHFHPRQRDRAVLNSLSHPRLSLPKPQQKRSLPLEAASRILQAAEVPIRRAARHATEVGKKPLEGAAKLRNSLNLTYDAGKKVATLPRLNEVRVSSKKAGTRKTL